MKIKIPHNPTNYTQCQECGGMKWHVLVTCLEITDKAPTIIISCADCGETKVMGDLKKDEGAN